MPPIPVTRRMAGLRLVRVVDGAAPNEPGISCAVERPQSSRTDPPVVDAPARSSMGWVRQRRSGQHSGTWIIITACAVGPDEAVNGPAWQGQAHRVEGGGGAEAARQLRHADDRFTHARAAPTSPFVVHVGDLDADSVRVAEVDLLTTLQCRLCLGYRGLERSERVLRVVIVNAEAEVVKPSAVSGFEAVKPEEAALQTELTEVLVFRPNWQARA